MEACPVSLPDPPCLRLCMAMGALQMHPAPRGLAASGSAVAVPQRVVAKKRDPLTHALFLDDLSDSTEADYAGDCDVGAAASTLPIDVMWCAFRPDPHTVPHQA